MSMDLERALGDAGRPRSARIELHGRQLEVEAGGRIGRIELPDDGEPQVGSHPRWSWEDEPLDLWNAFPRKPATGDQREKLLWAIMQDASPRVRGRKQDAELREGLRSLVHGSDQLAQRVVADVLESQYWVRPASAKTSFAFPFHSSIPANYDHPGRYKMYRGSILLFLCWDSKRGDIDPDPVEKLLDLLNSEDGLTSLDTELLEAARHLAADDFVQGADPSFLLRSRHADDVRTRLSDGAFHQPSLDMFREDLLAALSMGMPRHDKITAITLTLSFHLAIYYYRVAYLLGTGLEDVIAATSGHAQLPRRDFDEQIRFRVGTAGDRPISLTDPAALAWQELDDRYLIALSANIITANLLHHAWKHVEGDPGAGANPARLARALQDREGLRAWIDAAAAGLAVIYTHQHAADFGRDQLARIRSLRPGVHALREAVLERRRHGGSRGTTNLLKYHSRDVVNQLVRRPYGGWLLRNRGRVRFFEVDEDLLFLLVRFIVNRSGTRRRRIPFSMFLRGLRDYGMVPQNAMEEEILAQALERLGMLHRYSDAGEAQFVHHVL